MQLAPGDPLLLKAGRTGVSGQTSQTREAYLIQKRDLNLDKPLVLNFNYFRDYSERGPRGRPLSWRMTSEEIAAELPRDGRRRGRRACSPAGDSSKRCAIAEFAQRLAEPEQHAALAQAIAELRAGLLRGHGRVRGAGGHGDPRARTQADLRGEDRRDPRTEQHGARAVRLHLFAAPLADAETPAILADVADLVGAVAAKFPPLGPQRWPWCSPSGSRPWRPSLRGRSSWRHPAFRARRRPLLRREAPWATSQLFGRSWSRPWALRQLVGTPLATDVPADAQPAKLVAPVAENWLAWYEARHEQFQPGLAGSCWDIVADTQYAHMVVAAGHLPFRPLGREDPRAGEREDLAGACW